MADDGDKKRWVRFDFLRGLDVAAIPLAIREQELRILDENAPEKATEEKPVRFDFSTGESADVIAKALNEARKRIMAEYAAKQQLKKD